VTCLSCGSSVSLWNCFWRLVNFFQSRTGSLCMSAERDGTQNQEEFVHAHVAFNDARPRWSVRVFPDWKKADAPPAARADRSDRASISTNESRP
jgi:hypothetical protein